MIEIKVLWQKVLWRLVEGEAELNASMESFSKRMEEMKHKCETKIIFMNS